jgi:hypothetical protein
LLQSRRTLPTEIYNQLLLESKEGENKKCQFMHRWTKKDAEELAETAVDVYHQLKTFKIN